MARGRATDGTSAPAPLRPCPAPTNLPRRPSPAYRHRMRGEPSLPFVYNLGRRRATGTLRAYPSGETLAIREGAVIAPEHDALGRQAAAMLSRIATLPRSAW